MIYASIFSDPEIYSCNFKRLMKRIQNIAYLYNDEQNFLVTRGCGTGMYTSLTNLAQTAGQAANNSASIELLEEYARSAELANDAAGGCKIW